MLFEFQTQVARLFGCDVANASMYDGSTACWEAIVMARRITKRAKALLSTGLHPHYRSVARTMAKYTGDVLVDGDPALEAGTDRSEEHTSELQSLMRISYAVFCLKKNTHINSHIE